MNRSCLMACMTILAWPGLASSSGAPSRSMGSPEPDWHRLDSWQGAISCHAFQQLLDERFAPRADWRRYLEIREGEVVVDRGGGLPPYTLRLASDEGKPISPFPGGWAPGDMEKPLEGLHIALDPGHIGGIYARMEQRWFRMEEDHIPVAEGDLVLEVARRLRPELEAMGATVSLTRSRPEPVTEERPETMRDEAIAILAERRPELESSSETHRDAVKSLSELLFYRVSEIRSRARLVNEVIRPNLVLALHINASGWDDSARPSLVNRNDFHVLVNGAYMEGELALEDIRLEMLIKILNHSWAVEQSLAEAMAEGFRRETGLPPYSYAGDNASPVGSSGYVWARNLLANRLFECPVIYLEPYVANSVEGYRRIQEALQAGALEGLDQDTDTLLDEYVRSVLLGLRIWIRQSVP